MVFTSEQERVWRLSLNLKSCIVLLLHRPLSGFKLNRWRVALVTWAFGQSLVDILGTWVRLLSLCQWSAGGLRNTELQDWIAVSGRGGQHIELWATGLENIDKNNRNCPDMHVLLFLRKPEYPEEIHLSIGEHEFPSFFSNRRQHGGTEIQATFWPVLRVNLKMAHILNKSEMVLCFSNGATEHNVLLEWLYVLWLFKHDTEIAVTCCSSASTDQPNNRNKYNAITQFKLTTIY